MAWRSGLSKSLGENIAAVLDWDESGSSPYTTDRPGYPGYSGLMIWAAYSGDDAKVAPKDIPESGWYEDPIFQKAIEKDSGTPYRQIIQVEIWLPCEYNFVFQAPSPANQLTWFGSSYELMRQLDLMNENTFKAS